MSDMSANDPEPVDKNWIMERIGKKRGIQTALARHTGISDDKISKILKGKRRISQEEAAAIRNFFLNRPDFDGKPEGSDAKIGFQEAVAARLRQARESAGFTTGREASEILGISPSTYLGHENGSRGIKPGEAITYAKAFGFSLDWLYAGIKSSLDPTPRYGISALPPDAYRCVELITQGFDPTRQLLSLGSEELSLIREAVDLFKRVHGSDRPEDAEKLSEILESPFPRN